MSLTRAFLKGMGLTEEQIGAIVEANSDSLAGIKEQRDKFKKDLDEANSRLSAIDEKNGGKDWKTEYDTLKKSFDDFKKDLNTKEVRNKKLNSYKALLKDAGIGDKYIEAVLRVSDLEGITLADDGTITDADKLKESIKKDWPEFVAQENTNGANVDNPPASGTNHTMTKEQILAITDPITRQQKMSENLDLFQ